MNNLLFITKTRLLLAFLFSAIAFSASAQYTLKDSDVQIANGSIYDCSYDFTIKDIIIPETLDGQKVKDINKNTFKQKGITGLKLPKSLKTIGDSAFYFNDIVDLDLSECSALTFIGDYAFAKNDIADLDLSGCHSLVTIGVYTFYLNGITSINFNNCTNLTTIDNCAFIFNNLTSLDLNMCTSLTSIGINSFGSNRLTEVFFPSSLEVINYKAFNFNEIRYVNGVHSDGIFYYTNKRSKIVSYGGPSKTVIIPSQVDTIGYFAFAQHSLESVDLSACKNLTIIQDHAFYNCHITDLNLSNCTALYSIGRSAFDNNAISHLDFSDCKALTSIKINAFKNNKLSGIDLTSCTALTYIGDSAFNNNNFVEFELPTPYYSGFQNWIDGNSHVHAGGATVNNLTTSYDADVVTSISDPAKSNFNVYPNPTSNILTVVPSADHIIKEIDLHNCNGQKVKLPLVMKHNDALKLNMESLTPGLYLLRITTSDNDYFSKTVVRE